MRSFNQDTNGCFYLVFLFFIVSAVVGSATTFLFSWLGFPYEWSSIATLPLVGAGVWFIYRGYSLVAWGLLACIGISTIAGLALLRGFTVTEPQVPADLPEWVKDHVETQSDEDFLFGGYYGDFDYTNTFSTDEDEFLVLFSMEPRTLLTVQFPEIQTLNGQWAFKEGFVRTTGAIGNTFRANTDDNYVNTDEVIFEPSDNTTLQPADPYLSIALPLNQQQSDSEIRLDVELTVVYPLPDGESDTGFREVEETLTRSVEIYGIGADSSLNYYDYFNDYGNWKRAERIVEDRPGWIPLAAITLLSAVGAVVFLQRGAWREIQSGGSGGLQIRRLNGLQMLGVQAHPLTQVSSVSVESGVFLGVVIAQSPAGRAGLQSGDVLVAFGDKEMNSPGQLNRAAGRVKRGEVVQVRVIREGLPKDIFVRF